MNMYSDLAPFYDSLNGDVDLEKWANYFENQMKKQGRIPFREILDLGCGTGRMTTLLHCRGYDMVGLDLCEEMLAIAHENALSVKDGQNILWLCQDMTDFELYGTVDATVSCLDCLNHLPDMEALRKCLLTVHNYLVPDGLFMFDVNTPYKFQEIYGNNAYILEDEGVVCAWQNETEDRQTTFYISLFREEEDGRYTRFDSEQTETCFFYDELLRLFEETGFALETVHADVEGSPITPESERWFFTLRCLKP